VAEGSGVADKERGKRWVFSGFEGKLTQDKCMKMTKASSRTALRDIEELIAAGVIEQE
jgi:predicted HTH transcriptional regulator